MVSLPYNPREDLSYGPKRHILPHNDPRQQRTVRTPAVSESAPELLPYMGEWFPHQWLGRREKILLRDNISLQNGIHYVLIQREFPWTGGYVPVAHVLAAAKAYFYRGYQQELPDSDWGCSAPFTTRQ